MQPRINLLSGGGAVVVVDMEKASQGVPDLTEDQVLEVGRVNDPEMRVLRKPEGAAAAVIFLVTDEEIGSVRRVLFRGQVEPVSTDSPPNNGARVDQPSGIGAVQFDMSGEGVGGGATFRGAGLRPTVDTPEL